MKLVDAPPALGYTPFNPPRRIEEYPNRIPSDVIEEVARCRLAKQPPKYLIKGEWSNGDLDIAINYQWVDAVSNYHLVDGRLRWTCPQCGRLSGVHAKGCDYER